MRVKPKLARQTTLFAQSQSEIDSPFGKGGWGRQDSLQSATLPMMEVKRVVI
jgi:hypothetical protein